MKKIIMLMVVALITSACTVGGGFGVGTGGAGVNIGAGIGF